MCECAGRVVFKSLLSKFWKQAIWKPSAAFSRGRVDIKITPKLFESETSLKLNALSTPSSQEKLNKHFCLSLLFCNWSFRRVNKKRIKSHWQPGAHSPPSHQAGGSFSFAGNIPFPLSTVIAANSTLAPMRERLAAPSLSKASLPST